MATSSKINSEILDLTGMSIKAAEFQDADGNIVTGIADAESNIAALTELTIALSTSNTYTDDAVNTAVNAALASIVTKVDAILAVLVAHGLMDAE